MGIEVHGVWERMGRVERDVNSDLSLSRWKVFPRWSRGGGGGLGTGRASKQTDFWGSYITAFFIP